MVNRKQLGLIRGDLIGLLIGAVALGGLLFYGAISGQDLPFWPALLVVAVNIVSAIHVFLGVKKRKQQAQASGLKKTDDTP
ncbi:MAG: hypothetical protein A3F78_14770 [Burkholderiales bacterium RIFCSPLOWO2_12_FULL_61_40]|nr:MAG: hypothetical protein A3F78_14770 [Burkholderiales bacterium RIFCSPLOWO2_12_FULL_61_40]